MVRFIVRYHFLCNGILDDAQEQTAYDIIEHSDTHLYLDNKNICNYKQLYQEAPLCRFSE